MFNWKGIVGDLKTAKVSGQDLGKDQCVHGLKSARTRMEENPFATFALIITSFSTNQRVQCDGTLCG